MTDGVQHNNRREVILLRDRWERVIIKQGQDNIMVYHIQLVKIKQLKRQKQDLKLELQLIKVMQPEL